MIETMGNKVKEGEEMALEFSFLDNYIFLIFLVLYLMVVFVLYT